jgi:hypothetical protein
MKKTILALLTIATLAASTPANAWYRGGYYGGYYGGYGGYGAALGVMAGAALLGGVVGGLAYGGGYGYGYGGYAPYGGYPACVPRPIYNAWGQTVGYAAC